MKTYSRYEIAQHASKDDYWLILGNKVYAFVDFNHPGGWMTHAAYAGGKLDASEMFQLKHGRNEQVKQTLETYYIGVVEQEEPKDKIVDHNAKDRFPQRYDASWPYNVLGYGADRPWVPPLAQPETLLGLLDRRMVVQLTMGPLVYFLHHTLSLMLFNTINGDFIDGYWYNNAYTVGQQLYPQGIYKYFDMSSMPGYTAYSFEWAWVTFCDILSPLTLLIPLDVWFALTSGASWEGMDRFFLYYVPWAGINPIVGMMLDVQSEDGFGMLLN